jgi:hypothetical protein
MIVIFLQQLFMNITLINKQESSTAFDWVFMQATAGPFPQADVAPT